MGKHPQKQDLIWSNDLRAQRERKCTETFHSLLVHWNICEIDFTHTGKSWLEAELAELKGKTVSGVAESVCCVMAETCTHITFIQRLRSVACIAEFKLSFRKPFDEIKSVCSSWVYINWKVFNLVGDHSGLLVHNCKCLTDTICRKGLEHFKWFWLIACFCGFCSFYPVLL